MSESNRTASAKTTSYLTERLAAFICGVLILLITLVTATQAVCYWIPNWWRSEYAKYNTPQFVTGEMSLDDAVHITEQMLEYCIGRLDSLDETMATIDGVKRPFFTNREKSHLYDCRNIFLGAIRLRAISILLIAFLIPYVYFSIKRKKVRSGYSPERIASFSSISALYVSVLVRGYLKALGAVLLLAVFVVVAGLRNFTFLFTKFHHLFFDNDLWILDPGEDNLVNVMQEAVFADAAVTIGLMWVCTAALLAIAGLAITRVKR